MDPERGGLTPPGAPPSYDAVMDPGGAPPSYDSLYGELREVRTPGGFFQFICRAIGVLFATLCFTILLFVCSVIPIAMICVGAYYLHSCRVQPLIPVYLIVGGVLGLFKSFIDSGSRIRRYTTDNTADPEEASPQPNKWDGILNLFAIAWLVAGSYWVFGAYDSVYSDAAACHRGMYYFAFTLILLQYVMCLVILSCACCCGCFALCFNVMKRGTDPTA